MRKTIGTNISSEEHQLFKSIAESHGVSVSMYLRSIVIDVIAEEGRSFISQTSPNKCSLLKSA